MEVKPVLKALVEERADLIRGLILLCIFRPASYLLPKPLVWILAQAIASCFVVLQSSGRQLVRDYISIYGLTLGPAMRLAIQTHATRFYEFAILQKYISGQYQPTKEVGVRIEASDEIQRIVDGPGSFVIAQAHFARTASASRIFGADTFKDRPLNVVIFKVPPWTPMPHLWRMRVQGKQILRAAAALRPEGLTLISTGGALSGLIDKLRNERVVVSINADAHWGRNRSSSLERPFCAAARRTFSTGAAKMARLANVPVMLALPIHDEEKNEVRVRMFGPFTSQAVLPEQQDIDVTQQLLNAIEVEIGLRPAEYVLEIGSDRRWDAAARKWISLPAVTIETQRAPGVTS